MILAMTDQPWTASTIEVSDVRAERALNTPSDAEGIAEVPA
jgi:hypothetical protein